MLGGKHNKYATANAATDITSGIQDALAAAVGQSNAETNMAIHEVKNMFTNKVDKL